MIRTVFKWVLWLIIAAIILIWLIGGGLNKIVSTAEHLQAFSWSGLWRGVPSVLPALPWQPTIQPIIPPGLDGYGDDGSGVPNIGSLSPYKGQIALLPATAGLQDQSGQYVIVSAVGTQSVSLAGWSLQSSLTGVRAFIPEAASPFVVGQVNVVKPIVLAPGDSATVLTGYSPVGVSFAENQCTGYLGTLQSFSPPLPQSCPAPSSMLPSAAALGSSCAAYVDSVSPCVFPVNPPSYLSSACKTQVQTTLSYNGCVALYENTPTFSRHAWRVYLSEPKPLWRGHDTVRLLDANERVVAVITF